MKYKAGDRVYWIDLCAIQSAKILSRDPSIPAYRAIRDGEASACYLAHREDHLHPSPETAAKSLVENYYNAPGRETREPEPFEDNLRARLEIIENCIPELQNDCSYHKNRIDTLKSRMNRVDDYNAHLRTQLERFLKLEEFKDD